MPAKSLLRSPEKGANSHVYNRGAENKSIFLDSQDYDVFVSYLAEYLSSPHDPKSIKKDFTVKGRTYKGTPHLPKNYYGKLELLSFSLFPDHFHLILHQIEQKSVEGFIRSLCTRYSIYFNRKYTHRGALFEGPYKSAKIETSAQLLCLAAHIQKDAVVSTYPEYSDKRHTSWVNTKLILSALQQEGARNFADFEKKRNEDKSSEEILSEIILETHAHNLVKSDKKPVLTSDPRKQEADNAEIMRISRVPEYFSLIVLFFLLLGIGYSNVKTSSAQDTQQPVQVLAVTASEEPSPEPLDTVNTNSQDFEPIPTATPTPLISAKVTVNTEDGVSINIRNAPSIQSEKIGEAKAGDTFDLVSLHPGWLEIKLSEGTGFISTDYAFIY